MRGAYRSANRWDLPYIHTILVDPVVYDIPQDPLTPENIHVIGASLSEPHTSEFNSGIFIYILSVVRRSVNAS